MALVISLAGDRRQAVECGDCATLFAPISEEYGLAEADRQAGIGMTREGNQRMREKSTQVADVVARVCVDAPSIRARLEHVGDTSPLGREAHPTTAALWWRCERRARACGTRHRTAQLGQRGTNHRAWLAARS